MNTDINAKEIPNLPSINKVPTLLEEIEKKLVNIKKITDSSFKTNGEFYWNPNYLKGDFVSIHKTKDIGVLINVHQYIRTKDVAYNESAKLLGLNEYPSFLWLNFTYADWEHDIKFRINIIKQHKIISELESTKKELETFLTKEHRLDNLFERTSLLIKEN